MENFLETNWNIIRIWQYEYDNIITDIVHVSYIIDREEI